MQLWFRYNFWIIRFLGQDLFLFIFIQQIRFERSRRGVIDIERIGCYLSLRFQSRVSQLGECEDLRINISQFSLKEIFEFLKIEILELGRFNLVFVKEKDLQFCFYYKERVVVVSSRRLKRSGIFLQKFAFSQGVVGSGELVQVFGN